MSTRWLVGLAVLGASVGVPRGLSAQCPDGTPPPCVRAGRAPTGPTVDPNRVAILPFRVTTSDTLLGEGFAELLATQVTGEGSPRAVDMATVLSAWRAAGGGLRSPLPRARAVQLGRELGAGLVSEGSIVGLGSRVTVSASLVAVPGGEIRGTAEPVSGPADSLDALLRRATTGLLASVGGQTRAGEGTRFTESPTAMRAYLEGLSAWRRGRLRQSAAAFDRAIAEDSSFAQARFRRYLAANWGIAGSAPNARLAWERRAGLSQRERAILETLLGQHYPAPRLLEERIESRQRLASQYPDSPDAWYFLGDYYFHFGQAFARAEHLELARTALERSAGIDSQATVIGHLIWVGLLLRDTALLRRAWPALERTDDAPKWMFGWLIAASTGDAAMLAALRRRPIENAADPGALQGAFAAIGTGAPARLVDEMFDRWISAITEEEARANVQSWRGFMLVLTGRPAAAERAWAGLPATVATDDESRILIDLTGDATGLDVAGSVRRLTETGGGTTPAAARAACFTAVWRRLRGDSSNVDIARVRPSQPRCARALDAAGLAHSQAPDATVRLLAIDSVLRNTPSTATEAIEILALSLAWERRGEPMRALAAVRYSVGADFALRLEGRFAVLAGDTASAVRAYRRYLEITAEAEPLIAPLRDSARAELARLENRRR